MRNFAKICKYKQENLLPLLCIEKESYERIF